jgi:hypothetical protein
VLIFKLKKLRTDPIPILTHVFQNIVRSVSFGLAVIGVAQYSLCTFNKLFQGTTRLNWLFISSISALPIIIEAESRKGELALYLFPRVLETLWNLMKKKDSFKNQEFRNFCVWHRDGNFDLFSS